MLKLRVVRILIVIGALVGAVGFVPTAHAGTCDGGGPCDQLIAKVCHTPPLHCQIA